MRVPGVCRKRLGTLLAKAHVGLPKALGSPYCGVCGDQIFPAQPVEAVAVSRRDKRQSLLQSSDTRRDMLCVDLDAVRY